MKVEAVSGCSGLVDYLSTPLTENSSTVKETGSIPVGCIYSAEEIECIRDYCRLYHWLDQPNTTPCCLNGVGWVDTTSSSLQKNMGFADAISLGGAGDSCRPGSQSVLGGVQV